MTTRNKLHIEDTFPILDQILENWRPVIGEQFVAYKNHCQRMLNFCFLLHDCSEEDKTKLTIASAFHDIGIWTNNTVDYIPSSTPLAEEYLKQHELNSWLKEISLMISEHHKIHKFKDDSYPLVEVFRKGDLIDFSLGAVSCGLPKDAIHQIKKRFPNAGFHKFLLKIAAKWILQHPLNPVPMMKW